MRIPLLLLGISFALEVPAQVTPCADYTCDSLAVLEILQHNGVETIHYCNDMDVVDTSRVCEGPIVVESLTVAAAGRITKLDLRGQLVRGTLEPPALPEAIGKLTGLDTLLLESNHLDSLPDALANLAQLRYLELMANDFASLPRVLFDLTALEGLDISGNEMTSLPDSLWALSSLVTLNVSANFCITTLPSSTGTMTNLRRLFVIACSLSTLPVELTELDSLYVYLRGNYICDPGSELAAYLDAGHAREDWREWQECEGGVRHNLTERNVLKAPTARAYDLLGRPQTTLRQGAMVVPRQGILVRLTR